MTPHKHKVRHARILKLLERTRRINDREKAQPLLDEVKRMMRRDCCEPPSPS